MSDKDWSMDQGGSLSVGACDPRFVMMWEWTSMMPVIFRAEGFDIALDLLAFGEELIWSRFAHTREEEGKSRAHAGSCLQGNCTNRCLALCAMLCRRVQRYRLNPLVQYGSGMNFCADNEVVR